MLRKIKIYFITIRIRTKGILINYKIAVIFQILKHLMIIFLIVNLRTIKDKIYKGLKNKSLKVEIII